MGLRGKRVVPDNVFGRDFRLKPSSAKRRYLVVRDWIQCLPVLSGTLAGKLMRVYPWQVEFLRLTYGHSNKHPVRQSVLSIPRKNGKTGLAACLALAHLAGPLSEPYGEVYSAAADHAQASLIFRAMAGIIGCCPDLAEKCVIRAHEKTITHLPTQSVYKALSSDTGTKMGLSPSCVIYDELAQAHDRSLYDALITAQGARATPIMIVISTQAPTSTHIMSELYDHAKSVIDGAVDDPAFTGMLFTAPMSADIFDEDVWKACNPSLATIRSLPEMRSTAAQVKKIAAKEFSFRNLYLNQRIRAEAGFLPVADWIACEADYDEDSLRGEECIVGADLAQVRDLCAIVAFFPQRERILQWVWCPSSTADYNERIPYNTWHRQGHLFISKGTSTNKREIALKLGEIAEKFNVLSFVYDRWGMPELERLLDEEGVGVSNMIPFGQGYRSMSPAIESLERCILDKRIEHNGNPCLTWCFQNLVVDTDPAGNRKFTKAKAMDRIDPMIALVMAVGQAYKEEASNYNLEVVSL